MLRDYDAVVIGAGVMGSFVARSLMRKKLRVAVVEKENDVGCGVSKAHTAIVHPGYSGKPGALKSKLTVVANENYHNVCEELDVEFRRCGSVIVAKGENGIEKLHEKMNRGMKNGVKGMHLLSKEETLKIEPNLQEDIVASLYAPSTGVVDPWEFVVGAIENAVDNGAELFLSTKVLDIEGVEGHFKISTSKGVFKSRHVINCAGLYSDEINDMLEEPFFKIKPRSGEYIVLDVKAKGLVNGFVFQARESDTKGVIVSPTIHGNILVGPSSKDIEDKDDRSTSIERLDLIREISGNSVSGIPFDLAISSFAGVRPRPNWIKRGEDGSIEAYEDDVKDFIIGRGKKNRNFINVAGIKSPGFTCADEVGKYVAAMVMEDYPEAEDNPRFNPRRRKRTRFKKLNTEDKRKAIEKDADFGKIVCRCNIITRAEILDVIRRNTGATTVDGVKRRTGACLGRCHGSHCADEIADILSEELGAPKEETVEK